MLYLVGYLHLCTKMKHGHTKMNDLGQCTALFNMTECEQYWEARTKTFLL